MTNASQPPLIVHGSWEAFGLPDFSPACLKLKTYLRMTNVPYASRPGDPRKAPTRKIPFIVDEGETIGDSGLVIAHLKKKLGDPLDGRLSPQQQAMGHLVRRTCEESLYWAILYARFGDEEAWPHIAQQFRTIVPPVIGRLILKMIRKETLRNAWGQGISRHTAENVVAHGRADLDALSAILGDTPYLFGDAPSSYDATLFGSIANVLAFPPDGALAKHARTKENLVAFVERVKKTYWATPDVKA
jgi:glutathione S-transferase